MQNKVLNFTVPPGADGDRPPATGSYVSVRVTTTHPNSLLGELVV